MIVGEILQKLPILHENNELLFTASARTGRRMPMVKRKKSSGPQDDWSPFSGTMIIMGQ